MKSYFTFLIRNKLYTAIEVVGLGIALSFIVFIGSFVVSELGYDRQLKNTGNVYVGNSEEYYISSATIREQLEEALPEIEESCRMVATSIMGGLNLSYIDNGESVKQNALSVDANFFRFFTFPFAEGDRKTALDAKNSVVVSRGFAARHFADKSPMGQSLKITIAEGSVELTVTGVYEDFRNTVFPDVDFIYRIEQFSDLYPNMLRSGNGTTSVFFRLQPNADIAAMEAKALAILKEKDPLFMSGLLKEFRLIPFGQIHYGTTVHSMPFVGIINLNFVYLFLAAGLLLLVFALLNYISLTVAQIGFRAKEMATRRLLGAQRGGIVLRYILEALILTTISLGLAVLLTVALEPHFGSLIGKEVKPFAHIGAVEIGGIACVVLLTSLLAGITPALLVSRYKPIDVVKGQFAAQSRMRLGRIFIGLQNVVGIATLSIAFAMFLQLRYMAGKDMGYERSGIVSVWGAKQYADYHVDELQSLPFVDRVGHVQFSPVAAGRSSWGLKHNGEELNFEMFMGDTAAFDILGFRVVSRNAQPVNRSLWLTESTMRHLGVGYDCDHLVLGDETFPVCGIIKDFQRGGRTEEECRESNICYFVGSVRKEGQFASIRQLLVRVLGDERQAVRDIEKFYGDKHLHSEVSVSTLNTELSNLYGRENNNLKLIATFTLLTLMLSSMSMVAMSTYYAKQQAKNVSIKKVFGFERRGVFLGMVSNFLRIVLYAAIVAVPLGFAIVRLWLRDYSYRIDNHWWIYLTVLLVVLVVSAIAISWQAVRLMNTNPVETLKKE